MGSTALLLWATLATLTAAAGGLPPLQLLAMSFALASLIGLALSWVESRRAGEPFGAVLGRSFRLPRRVWAVGIYGLFGYHLCYFLALQNAPPADANLINYLWPLLLVLITVFLPGERLHWYQAAGALLGFGGIVVLVTRGQGVSLAAGYLPGYLLALGCAVIWATYSLASRRLGHVPTSAVGAFCAATAALATILHLWLESTMWPAPGQWLAVLGLGLGPVGLAFYTWDYGVKRGDIHTLGTLAYTVPPVSTLLLIATGQAALSGALLAASVLIAAGALLASGRWHGRRS